MDMERRRREQLRRLLVALGDSESSIWWVSQEYFGAIVSGVDKGKHGPDLHTMQTLLRFSRSWAFLLLPWSPAGCLHQESSRPKRTNTFKGCCWQKPIQLYKAISLQLKKNIQLLPPPCTSFSVLPRHSHFPQRLFCLSFPKFPATSSNLAGKASLSLPLNSSVQIDQLLHSFNVSVFSPRSSCHSGLGHKTCCGPWPLVN